MDKIEYIGQIKQIFDNTPKQQREKLRLSLDGEANLYEAWSHCHKCGFSNHRFKCYSAEEFQEILTEYSEVSCIHCGKSGLKFYKGYAGTGEDCDIPKRADYIHMVKQQLFKMEL